MIDGKPVNLVPSLLGVQHDNPEGRDSLALFISNNADALCCLCYAPGATCADNTIGIADLKYMFLLDEDREAVKAEAGNAPGKTKIFCNSGGVLLTHTSW